MCVCVCVCVYVCVCVCVARQRRWSEPDSWPEGRLPVEGEEVTVSSKWRMLVDITPPPLASVFVFG